MRRPAGARRGSAGRRRTPRPPRGARAGGPGRRPSSEVSPRAFSSLSSTSRSSSATSSASSVSSPISKTRTRACWRSTRSTPIGSWWCRAASSWPTAGAWPTTSWLRTGTGRVRELPEPVGPTREHGHAARPCDRSRPSLTWRSMAARSRRDAGAVPVGVAAGVAQQPVELLLVLGSSGEPTSVDVEVAAGDHPVGRTEAGELTDAVIGEVSHPPRVGRRETVSRDFDERSGDGGGRRDDGGLAGPGRRPTRRRRRRRRGR